LDSLSELSKAFPDEDLIYSTNLLTIFRECHLNLALSHIKLTNYEEAVDILSALQHYEPLNAKALYLRAKCYQVLR
jgi:Flp pilus assembly protein TadD